MIKNKKKDYLESVFLVGAGGLWALIMPPTIYDSGGGVLLLVMMGVCKFMAAMWSDE